MSQTPIAHEARHDGAGEPAWDIARLFPNQGHWSEQEYFELSDRNRLVEFSQGRIEVLPMPTISHQRIVLFRYRILIAPPVGAESGRGARRPVPGTDGGGEIPGAGPGVMLREHADPVTNEYRNGADLVVEVVSDDNRTHDLDTKRTEYARAGIPQYWIVDPREGTITVLALGDGATEHAVHGVFARGERATSRLLPGLEIDVAGALEAKA